MEFEIKVLIVDDDDVFLFLHDLLVKDSGLSQDPGCFLTAKSALEYLDANHQTEERYLVLLDINMPGMSGWQFLEYLDNTTYKNKVSVVLVTSSIEAVAHQKARTYPTVKAYVEKPLVIEMCIQLREGMMKKTGLPPLA